jgi:hypothetical protein
MTHLKGLCDNLTDAPDDGVIALSRGLAISDLSHIAHPLLALPSSQSITQSPARAVRYRFQ